MHFALCCFCAAGSKEGLVFEQPDRPRWSPHLSFSLMIFCASRRTRSLHGPCPVTTFGPKACMLQNPKTIMWVLIPPVSLCSFCGQENHFAFPLILLFSPPNQPCLYFTWYLEVFRLIAILGSALPNWHGLQSTVWCLKWQLSCFQLNKNSEQHEGRKRNCSVCCEIWGELSLSLGDDVWICTLNFCAWSLALWFKARFLLDCVDKCGKKSCLVGK